MHLIISAFELISNTNNHFILLNIKIQVKGRNLLFNLFKIKRNLKLLVKVSNHGIIEFNILDA